jgi:hypothetical protein
MGPLTETARKGDGIPCGLESQFFKDLPTETRIRGMFVTKLDYFWRNEWIEKWDIAVLSSEYQQRWNLCSHSSANWICLKNQTIVG